MRRYERRGIIDLGSHVFLDVFRTPEDVIVGFELHHPLPNVPNGCGGQLFLVTFERAPGVTGGYDMVQEDPLTLSPSLLCLCGLHGWVRDGKWVPV